MRLPPRDTYTQLSRRRERGILDVIRAERAGEYFPTGITKILWEGREVFAHPRSARLS